MKISGNYTFDANSKRVWDMIMNREVLERILPGIEKLIEKGEDTYEAISQVRIGAVNGEFKGVLSILNKVKEKSCKLVVNQKSTMGNVVAEINMKLNELGGETKVNYTGEAKMSGMLATKGQRIMSGVVNSLFKQFFQSLEEVLIEKKI